MYRFGPTGVNPSRFDTTKTGVGNSIRKEVTGGLVGKGVGDDGSGTSVRSGVGSLACGPKTRVGTGTEGDLGTRSGRWRDPRERHRTLREADDIRPETALTDPRTSRRVGETGPPPSFTRSLPGVREPPRTSDSTPKTLSSDTIDEGEGG